MTTSQYDSDNNVTRGIVFVPVAQLQQVYARESSDIANAIRKQRKNANGNGFPRTLGEMARTQQTTPVGDIHNGSYKAAHRQWQGAVHPNLRDTVYHNRTSIRAC